MYCQTIKVVQVNPHSISSEHAIAPLESLGRVEVRVIERVYNFKGQQQKPLIRQSKRHKLSSRAIQKSEFKERMLKVLRDRDAELTIREISRILEVKVQDERHSYQTIQNYLYELISAEKVTLNERIVKGMKREYFSVSQL